jgi:hypothetical protein
MHVYRNRRYEEEIVMLMWHKKGEQKMIGLHGSHGHGMFILAITENTWSRPWLRLEPCCRIVVYTLRGLGVYLLGHGVYNLRNNT